MTENEKLAAKMLQTAKELLSGCGCKAENDDENTEAGAVIGKVAKVNFSPEDQKRVDSILKKFKVDKMGAEYKKIETWMNKLFKAMDNVDIEDIPIVKKFFDNDNYQTFTQKQRSYDFKADLNETLEELEWYIRQGNDEEGFKYLINWAGGREEDIEDLNSNIPKLKRYFGYIVGELSDLK